MSTPYDPNPAPLTAEMINKAMQDLWDRDVEQTREWAERVRLLNAEFDMASLPWWCYTLLTQREPAVVGAGFAKVIAAEMEKVRR